ncbi:unannotated protein [freshwater metagenome]|uniref:Unannotated protein n=1 Tax=freshwater metagenome TaxID=449393 RepID=A0A6J6HX67_9ZZZZ
MITPVPAAPGVKAMVADAFRAVAESEVGAAGSTRGVAVTATDAVPAPNTLTGRNLIEYAVPFVRPMMDTGDVASAGLSAVQTPVPI